MLTTEQVYLHELSTTLTIKVALITNARRPEFGTTLHINRYAVMVTLVVRADEREVAITIH
jgi:hypothetical protein